MLKLSAEDHAKVSAAIAAAEAKSDGEIIAIAAEQSDAYHDVGLHYAVLVLFLVLAFFAAWPHQLEVWWTRLMGWSSEPTLRQLLTLLLGLALLMDVPSLVLQRLPAATEAAGPLDPILFKDDVARGFLHVFTAFLNVWRRHDMQASLNHALARLRS